MENCIVCRSSIAPKHETDLRFSSPKLDACLCDAGASFSLLEFELEVVLDPPSLTPPLVAPSSPSTLRDNATFNMTLLNPPLPFFSSVDGVRGR